MIGAKLITEAADLFVFGRISGRGAFHIRVKVDRKDYWTKWKRLCRNE